MTRHITPAALSQVMALIAARVLDEDSVPARLAEITLRAHQRHAADRLCALIAAHGGALLADQVGLGKTFTALAVAGALHERPLVIAPAALRDMWLEAARRADIDVTFVSHEALSRGADVRRASFVIVDEAHRVRSPHTQRYAAVAAICARARVLLLTATPVQNRQSDLAAQLALFLGRRAWSASEDELAQHVVRGGAEAARMPRLDGPHAIALATAETCVDQLLALPPPIPARNESIAAALLTYGLLHQWTSSRAALMAALVRRRARGAALTSALDAGRRPSRAELSAWTHAGDSLQLAFPELVVDMTADVGDDVDALRAALDRHSVAVEDLLHALARTPDPDRERAEILRKICAKHPGERVIAFCQYAETVHAMWAALRREAGVAALTASGARVASGRIPRREVIEQFTPNPNGTTPECRVDRIDLLITTDLLSEGLNLQEASVVVHLDLPWNPARLDQRVGRVRRLGSRHESITVYTLAPPLSAERLLQLEARLRSKLDLARRTIGVAGRILPSVTEVPPPARGAAERAADIRERLRTWRQIGAVAADQRLEQTLIAAAAPRITGFVALIEDADGPRLVADLADGITASTEVVARALESIDGQMSSTFIPDADDGIRVLQRLESWMAAQSGAATVDLAAAGAARSRRKALARVAQALARAPRHQRAAFVPLADAARAIGTAALGEGAERILDTLVAAPLDDEAWLRSVAAFSALNARPAEQTIRARRILAVVLV